MAGRRGNRGEVRDGQDLPRAPDLKELGGDAMGEAATDPGVHLVEDERWHPVHRGERGLEREDQARELSTRSDGPQRCGGLAGVRGDQELHALEASRLELD